MTSDTDLPQQLGWPYSFYKGRLNRRNYLICALLNGVICVSGIFLIAFFIRYTPIMPELSWALDYPLEFSWIAIIIANSYSLHTKRLHDLGYSGWWALFLLVPLVNIIASLMLFFYPGDSIENKYGKPPTPKIDVKPLFGFRLFP
jgi:uncharacterized membrane protein YhaH (DUF805 family)